MPRYYQASSLGATDYQHVYVDGLGNHPYGIPGVACDACGETWSSWRILPWGCPPAFQTGHRIRRTARSPGVLPIAEHLRLRHELRTALAATGQDPGELRPSDKFQPLIAEFPSRPNASFHWCVLGSVVTSAAVRRCFEEEGVTGVTFCPVDIRFVGKADPSAKPPRPRTGEPEDVLMEVKPESDPAAFGPLYEMVVTEEAGRSPDLRVISHCATCGREAFDGPPYRKETTVTPEMLPRTDVFLYGLHIVVSQRVADLIRHHRFTNVALEEWVQF